MSIDPATRRLGARLAAVETEQRAQATSAKLAHSSIEDGSLDVKVAGDVRSFWGLQPDGTVATVYTDGPTPGVPAAPHLVAHQLAVVVQWDGSFEEGDPPADLAHVQVHVSEQVDELGKFEPTLDTLTGTLTPGGGALTFAGDNDTHYVCLVAITTSRKASEPSDYQSVTPLPADVIMGDELIGKIVTGGIVRTAPDGPRVELNANVDEQSLRFVGARGDVATITQSDATSGVNGPVIGTGISLMSSPGDSGTAGAILLLPTVVGLTTVDSTTGNNLAQIYVDGTGGLGLYGAEGSLTVDADGILIYDTEGSHFWCTADGTWRLRGAGDVGGPTGGIFRVSDRTNPNYFMEMDANEIQSNPYGERMHLNLDSGSGVTLANSILAFRSPRQPTYGMIQSYGGAAGTSGILFAGSVQARPLNDAGGFVDFWGNNIAASDPEAKGDIVPLETALRGRETTALDEVTGTPTYTYTDVDAHMRGEDGSRRGLMSTDLPADLVVENDVDGTQGVNLYGLVTTLWAAVQQLTQRVEALDHG